MTLLHRKSFGVQKHAVGIVALAPFPRKVYHDYVHACVYVILVALEKLQLHCYLDRAFHHVAKHPQRQHGNDFHVECIASNTTLLFLSQLLEYWNLFACVWATQGCKHGHPLCDQ